MLRGRRVRRLAALTAGLALAASLVVGTAAAASPGVDLSYGEGGIVRLGGVVPPGLYPNVFAPPVGALAQPDGAVLNVASTQTCQLGACERLASVMRYGPDGRLDPTYGEGGFLTLQANEIPYTGMAVDQAGRLLVVTQPDTGPLVPMGDFTLTRYTRDGRLDGSFGSGGRVSLPAPAETEARFAALVVTPDGKLTLVRETEAFPTGSEAELRKVTLVRLLPDGRPDRGFGKTGQMSFATLGGVGDAVATPGNGLLISGSSCCATTFTPVSRVAASGRLDTRFGVRERRAQVKLLRGLPRVLLRALVPRGGGGVDLLGGYEGGGAEDSGFAIRLDGEGNADTTFGKHGISILGHELTAGIAGAGGSTLALYETFLPSTAEGAQVHAERLLGDGRPDPSFGGGAGIALPGIGGPGGILGASGWGVSIFVGGNRRCIEFCPPLPYLTRLIEPAAPEGRHGKGKHR